VDSVIEFIKETYFLSLICGVLSAAITGFAGWALLKAVRTTLSSEEQEQGEESNDDG
tara:strand:- start:25 stop:195 length:171 start_codon:yes stop_codon:yes gene_type:complete